MHRFLLHPITGLLVFVFLNASGVLAQAGVECSVAYDGIDLKTKKYTFEMEPALLFHYTPPELRNELGERGLLNGSAQISQIEETVILNMNIEVFSRLAPSKYGEILSGNLMRIILIDGKQIDLKCRTGSDGENYVENNSYIYPLSYVLDKSERRALARLEIDKIGIQWTSGYEEYLVYEVDFLINQLTCLKNKNKRPN